MMKINKKTVLCLMCIIGTVSVILLRQYIFGNRLFVFNDIGSDTMQQYIQQYSSIALHLRDGDFSFWDFTNGFGTNMFLYNMTNPILMIVYISGAVFGTEVIPYMMVYVYLAELLLSAVSIYLFLSLFSYHEKNKLLVAIMYTFNGFMLVWGQHYQFGIIATLVPLELLMTERYLRNPRRWKALVLMTMILVLNSMYIAYMTLLTSGVYVVLRVMVTEKILSLSYLRKVVRTALVMLLGVGCAGITLVPSALGISKVSVRLGESASLLTRLTSAYPREYYVTLVGRSLSTTARGINVYDGYKNYYEGPCLFFSTLFLFLIVQYVILLPKKQVSLKRKAVEFTALLIAGFSVTVPFTGVVLNAFVGEFQRFFFLIMVYFAFVSGEALREILERRRFSVIGFLLSCLFIARFTYTYYFAPLQNSKLTILALSVSGIIMAALLWVYAKNRDGNHFRDRVVISLLLVLLVGNVYMDAWNNVDANSMTEITYSRLAMEKKGEYEADLYDEDTLEALKFIREENTQFHRTEKMYSQTMSMGSMVQQYYPVSTYNSTLNGRTQEYVRTYWPELMVIDINHLLFDSEGVVNRVDQEGLAGIRYILRREDDPSPEGYSFYRRFGSVIVMKREDVTNISSFYGIEDVVEEQAEDGSGSLVMQYDLRDRDAVIETQLGANQGIVHQYAEIANEGWLYTAIPYEAGWTVYVDGQETEIRLSNRGFSAVHLEEGNHTIEYRYTAPGLKAGMGMSLLSWLLMIVLSYRIRRKNGRKEHGISDYAI